VAGSKVVRADVPDSFRAPVMHGVNINLAKGSAGTSTMPGQTSVAKVKVRARNLASPAISIVSR
jgi:hypothetical protein